MPQNWHFKSQFPPRKISRSNWLAPGKIRSLCSLLTSGLCQLVSLLYYSPEEPQSSSWIIITTSYQYLMCLHVTSWKILWTEEPGRLQSMGSRRVGHEWTTSLWLSLSCIGEGNGNPLQCSCLENPRDGGAWWAAVYGVTQRWTWLKRLSMSHPASKSSTFPGASQLLLFVGDNWKESDVSSIAVYQVPRTDLLQLYQEKQLWLAQATDHPQENLVIIQETFGFIMAKETS